MLKRNNFEENKRPLDVLNYAKNKKVVVYLKNKTTIRGVLQALDIHLNMWLNDAEIQSDDKNKKFATIHAELLDAEGKVCSEAEVKYFIFPIEIAKRKFHYPGIEAFFED